MLLARCRIVSGTLTPYSPSVRVASASFPISKDSMPHRAKHTCARSFKAPRQQAFSAPACWGLILAPCWGLILAPCWGLTLAPSWGLILAPRWGLILAPLSRRSFGIPSYHVQRLFAQHQGSWSVNATVTDPQPLALVAASATCDAAACARLALKVRVLGSDFGPLEAAASGLRHWRIVLSWRVQCSRLVGWSRKRLAIGWLSRCATYWLLRGVDWLATSISGAAAGGQPGAVGTERHGVNARQPRRRRRRLGRGLQRQPDGAERRRPAGREQFRAAPEGGCYGI